MPLIRTNGGLSKRDRGKQAGVDHLLYFCANRCRTASPRKEERAPEEREDDVRELKGVKQETCQRANGSEERKDCGRNREKDIRQKEPRGEGGGMKRGERYTKLQQRHWSRRKRVNEWVSERVRVRQRLSHFS